MLRLRDIFYYLIGIGFLALAKAKNILLGYTTPKPFSISEPEKCVEYDMHVVELWLFHLLKFTHSETFLIGKNVLELGPGSDLGVGIYLLALGAKKYNACDVNDLVKTAPDSFYRLLFERLRTIKSQSDIKEGSICLRGYFEQEWLNIDILKEYLVEMKAGHASRLNYIVRSDFDLVSAFGVNTIDLVFSQAAFEHLDDFDSTVEQLSVVCKPGAVVVAEIDLKTHSRWIRDRDPNNIYRYGNNVYKAFWFRGIPNRIRPFNYKETFERFGWKDVSIIPLSSVNISNRRTSCLNKRFRADINQMDYLSIMLCARKPE